MSSDQIRNDFTDLEKLIEQRAEHARQQAIAEKEKAAEQKRIADELQRKNNLLEIEQQETHRRLEEEEKRGKQIEYVIEQINRAMFFIENLEEEHHTPIMVLLQKLLSQLINLADMLYFILSASLAKDSEAFQQQIQEFEGLLKEWKSNEYVQRRSSDKVTVNFGTNLNSGGDLNAHRDIVGGNRNES